MGAALKAEVEDNQVVDVVVNDEVENEVVLADVVGENEVKLDIVVSHII